MNLYCIVSIASVTQRKDLSILVSCMVKIVYFGVILYFVVVILVSE